MAPWRRSRVPPSLTHALIHSSSPSSLPADLHLSSPRSFPCPREVFPLPLPFPRVAWCLGGAALLTANKWVTTLCRRRGVPWA
ncbi:hypothetical protein E2C01_075609 [Portunus trituberculatus]|uniref:Uncharacterized protein n=1 Tax=Portunus trituberculatus TaxID=210409 RepID=A0A5B7IGJ4_PORTR|nr:hypothetical protein [Portunus trituberculatus]